jgi:hypothetical protein
LAYISWKGQQNRIRNEAEVAAKNVPLLEGVCNNSIDKKISFSDKSVLLQRFMSTPE